MPGTLLIATHNAGKVRELGDLLAPHGWRCEAVPPGTPEFVEDGETFAANARGKALYYAGLTGLPAIADDSGLEIEALDGEPGVYSARYIDPDLDQPSRNAAVLERLAEIPDTARSARFVCHLALAVAGRLIHETTGICRGEIIREARGVGGFGYDPIFRPTGGALTFAEIDAAEKARFSHRGKAVRAMLDFLAAWKPPGSAGVS